MEKRLNDSIVKIWIYSVQLSPVAELDSAGNVITRFAGGYLVKGGNTYQLITDHLGSVRLVVDAATGTVAQQLEYDEYGNVISDSNPDFQPFAYAGGLYETRTELVRFGFRDYSAKTGRWTKKDPIGFAGNDANIYNYVSNDPENGIDINGLMCPIPGNTFQCLINKTIENITSAINGVVGIPAAIDVLYEEYNKMVEARTKGADKYFHCVGMCRAARESSPKVADYLGRCREIIDNVKNRFTCDLTPLKQAQDSMEDIQANKTGFTAPLDQSCENACSKYKVPGL